MRGRKVAWLLLLALFTTARGAWADEAARRFIQARQLILLERYDQALTLVEGVVPASADEWRTREGLLAEIYRGQKNYTALDLLARQAMDRDPGRGDRDFWQFIRAEMYLLADHVDSARSLLDSLWKSDPTDSTVSKAAKLYEQHSLSDLAAEVYSGAREQSGDSTRFALELAVLCESRRDYAQATKEYFKAIARDSSLAREVENRVLQLMQTEEGREAIQRELEAAASTRDGAVPARRLLIALYLEAGLADRAWRAAWEMDSLNGQSGMSLIMFMRQASERGYYRVAADAASRILEEYPDSPVRQQAEWELAVLSQRVGDWRAAMAQYERMSRESPVWRFRAEAALEYASLRLEHDADPGGADSVYADVARQQPAGIYFDRAMLGLVEVATRRGDFEGARALLSRLAQSNPHPPAREELTYRLGELAYFEGDFESARGTWNGLVSDFPRSPWVNDALRYVLLLTAYADAAHSDLVRLAGSEAAARRGDYDSALALVAGLRGSPEAPLAPRALWLAAVYHLGAGRYDSALALLDEFIVRYPADPDAPLALLKAARICEDPGGRMDAALARYRALLEAYPRTHWSDEARQRIRSLEGL